MTLNVGNNAACFSNFLQECRFFPFKVLMFKTEEDTTLYRKDWKRFPSINTGALPSILDEKDEK
jgi:hypothetical protein